MGNKRIKLSQQRDLPVLNFLWKWKVVTTGIIARVFYGRYDCEAGYRRLKRLADSGLVRTFVTDDGSVNGWMLTDDGYDLICGSLPPLIQEGFRSESVCHDLLVTMVHLGEFVHGLPEGTSLFSEQELRRIDPDDYPKWVPSGSGHRPDGYWRIPRGNEFRVLALEVELTRKRHVDFGAVAAYYSRCKEVDRVVWIVRNQQMGERLHSLFSESRYGRADYHNFISFPNFQKNVWRAEIECGPEAEVPMRELLVQHSSSTRPVMDYHWITDTRRSPHFSPGYKLINLNGYRD